MLWIAISILFAFITACWDIKVCWGFLTNATKFKYLRSPLSLKKYPYFYYSAFMINCLLRVFWVLAISPGVTIFFKHRFLLMLVFGCIELLRRVLWNFLTMENMHVIVFKMFRVIKPLSLPYFDLDYLI